MKKLVSCIAMLMISTNVVADSIQLEAENDLFYETDRRYTHGTRLTYEHDDINWFVQQNIYTPDEKINSMPLVDQRAYAGVLMVGLRGDKKWEDKDIYNQLEMSVGTVGKYSFAEQTQKQVHKWVDSDQPMGWDYQTDDMLWLDVNGRIYGDFIATKYVNLHTFVLGEVGTALCNFGGGTQLALGYNVPHSVDKPMISKAKTFSLYVYAELVDRHVVYNKLLESDYNDIQPTDNVADTIIGVGFKYGRFETKFNICERSPEYKEQKDNSKFGSISIKIGI